MPSLRDVAHDRWLCTGTFTMQQQLMPSACSWAAPVRANSTVRKRQAVRPVRHIQNHTWWSLSSSQPGGPPCWASPLAFGQIGDEHRDFSLHVGTVPMMAKYASCPKSPFPDAYLFLYNILIIYIKNKEKRNVRINTGEGKEDAISKLETIR
jgi:hypothetical protein